jgi:hypothetical protein
VCTGGRKKKKEEEEEEEEGKRRDLKKYSPRITKLIMK